MGIIVARPRSGFSAEPTFSVGSVNYVDFEVPVGDINGVNYVFTLQYVPNPTSSLRVTKNGLIMKINDDYSVENNTIRFHEGAIPTAGSNLFCWYRYLQTEATRLVDFEIPAGTVDGTNLTFTLLHAPNPASSLKILKNGIVMKMDDDYVLTGDVITFNSMSVPRPGSNMFCWYRW